MVGRRYASKSSTATLAQLLFLTGGLVALWSVLPATVAESQAFVHGCDGSSSASCWLTHQVDRRRGWRRRWQRASAGRADEVRRRSADLIAQRASRGRSSTLSRKRQEKRPQSKGGKLESVWPRKQDFPSPSRWKQPKPRDPATTVAKRLREGAKVRPFSGDSIDEQDVDPIAVWTDIGIDIVKQPGKAEIKRMLEEERELEKQKDNVNDGPSGWQEPDQPASVAELRAASLEEEQRLRQRSSDIAKKELEKARAAAERGPSSPEDEEDVEFTKAIVKAASAELSKVEILESRLHEAKEIDPFSLPDEIGWPRKNRRQLLGRNVPASGLMKRIDEALEAGAQFEEREPFAERSTPEERQLIARVSANEARTKARQRKQREASKPQLADDVGTGPASPNVYVHIRPRPGPEEGQPERETLDHIVSTNLDITHEQARKLIKLGSVWVFDEYLEQDWVRVMEPRSVDYSDPVRVFPNPVRCETCYVRDWEQRVKKVDRDFVVVDKPPLLPCLEQISNKRETLSKCLEEGLHLRKWGGYAQEKFNDMPLCSVIDDEASGLVVMARHEKAADVFSDWVDERKVIFEFVALVKGFIDTGIYRHYYEKDAVQDGLPAPALYEEPPPHLIQKGSDYENWEMVEMEVVATAELEEGCWAVRIRTPFTWHKERIRAQLALLGAPVINDEGAMAAGTPVDAEVAGASGLVAAGAFGSLEAACDCQGSEALMAAPKKREPLGGAVDESVLYGPYGSKLRLLPAVRQAVANGMSQKPNNKVPVALHLARVEFGGRVVTCAPPKFWPEFAAAAVAVKLTAQDIETQVFTYLKGQGGHARFGEVGGRFGVRREFLEEHFPIDVSAGLVFASTEAKHEWDAQVRRKSGGSAWLSGVIVKRKAKKMRDMELREKYIKPGQSKRLPTYKQIKKGKVKPLTAS